MAAQTVIQATTEQGILLQFEPTYTNGFGRVATVTLIEFSSDTPALVTVGDFPLDAGVVKLAGWVTVNVPSAAQISYAVHTSSADGAGLTRGSVDVVFVRAGTPNPVVPEPSISVMDKDVHV